MHTPIFLRLLLGLALITSLGAQEENDLTALARIHPGVKSRRVSSYDRSGGNGDNLSGLPDGAKVDIMNVQGAGVITHIWITLAPGAEKLNRNDVVLRMYWDGNAFPSVEAPIGPFFGNGWGEAYNFVSVPLAVTPGWGKSYVSYFAMPFATGARIELENQSGQKIDALYFNIDYEELPKLPADLGRFPRLVQPRGHARAPGRRERVVPAGQAGQQPRRQGQLRLRRYQGPAASSSA
ncbi:MAG: DUF2961 domain-containing protein [Lacunisphaera sp.]